MEESPRTFKTAWFAKAAKKARIADAELCAAIEQVRLGQADDLGGGVFKKRLDRNRSRSIVLAKGERYWIYQYLFAKKDQANIDVHDLANLRALAKTYARLSVEQVAQFLADGDWVEICDDDQA